MENIFEKYLQSISAKFSHEETSEMGYRTDFEILLKGIFESINVKRIDHDPKARDSNKPDFIVMKNSVPILYLEAKDIGVSLDKVEKSEQMARYYGYANLVLTDYLEFRFYRNGMRYEEPIKIADCDIKNRTIAPLSDHCDHLAKTLIDFTQSHKEPIRSGGHLSKIMGGKAQRIRDNIRHYLANPSEQNAEILRVYETIKKLLVHDLTLESFADMYAQTLVYGLFVARFHDKTPETFTRQEARDLVPKTNPLLRHFFDHIVGPDFDKRLEYIVNELCAVFSHADIQVLMRQYFKDDLWGKTVEGPDPVIHFYEDFLKEYDPELRKKMGAFYTPLPVVRFIVRSVDHLLEKEFGLSAGLADTSKLANGAHRVQILDPAAGTGTFLAEVLHNIKSRFADQAGRWPAYVHHDLLPRLHGFELMMAPYTIAHLKLGMVLKETGFKYFNNTRLGVYLTNSLEGGTAQASLFDGFGFAESIAEESRQASIIKNKKPIMVVVGNPPYSGVSSNETDYANSLVAKYKIEPGGKIKLQERKHWLNDDYVKFIAFAEDMIAKNGEGIVSFITNHGYIDNPTFRGMRWHLMDTFDSIYIIDLHGNAKKKEVSPDGSRDENVFAIQQGVAILLAVKTGKKKKGDLAEVYHADIWGSRESKYEQLNDLSIKKVKWQVLESSLPNLFFAPEGSSELNKEYQKGFDISELFIKSTTGIVTMGDGFIVDENKDALRARVDTFLNEDITADDLTKKYDLGKNYAKWVVENKKNIVNDPDKIAPFAYRPFDNRYTYFDNKLVWRPRTDTMRHFIDGGNMGIILTRQAIGESGYNHVMVSRSMSDNRVFFSNKGIPIEAPLYLYSDDNLKAPNLKQEIVADMEKVVGKVSPEDIFDYIYAVLHSPNYRERYKEFLKIDFPRVPYPKDVKTFKKLVALGAELRALHLLESPKVNKFITTYPVAGLNLVEKVAYKDSKVFINKDQYFGKVPEIAWNFYIGGYQPAQKWLKDRKGRALTNSDIEHYQKIIVALVETDRIMEEIDEVGVR